MLNRVLILFLFIVVNVGIYVLGVHSEHRLAASGLSKEIGSPVYFNASDGQRYWGVGKNLSEGLGFVVTEWHGIVPLRRAGPLPGIVFSIPIKVAGFDNAPPLIIFIQCGLLFLAGQFVRRIASEIKASGGVAEALVIFNPNLISLAHHAQSEIVFVLLFSGILYYCTCILVAGRDATWTGAIIFGVCLGLLPLARPLGLYVIVVGAGILLVVLFLCMGRDLRRYFSGSKVLVIGVIAILIATPWAVRNHLVLGSFGLSQSEGIMMEWHYNSLAMLTMEPKEHQKELGVAHQALRNCGGSSNLSCRKEVSRIYLELILDKDIGGWGYALAVSWGQVLVAGGSSQFSRYLGVETPALHTLASHTADYWSKARHRVLSVIQEHPSFLILFLGFLGFSVISRILGVIGIASVGSDTARLSVALFFLALILLFLCMYLFSGIARFRAPLEPMLAIFATLGIERVRQKVFCSEGRSDICG